MAGYDRNKMRDQLLKRTQEEYVGGVSYRYFNADHDLPLWAPKSTKDVPYIIDIIPYTASKTYPQLDKGISIKEGDAVYRLEIMIHQNIGPRKEWIVCPTANYGLPCPVCEEIDILQANGKEYEDFKEIALKRRCSYNVIVYDGKNDDKIQIWEVSHKYSEKAIRLQAKSPRTGGIEPFADPDVGKSISFEIGNDEYKTVQGHKLIPRDYVIPDEILAKAYTLEDEIVIRSYDEIEKIFHFKIESKEVEKTDNAQSLSRRPGIIQTAEKETDVPDNICIGGGKFGEDIDKLEPCGKCKMYDSCAAENDKITLRLKAARDAKRMTISQENPEVIEQKEITQPATQVRRLRRPV